jgi:hypothetical protein
LIGLKILLEVILLLGGINFVEYVATIEEIGFIGGIAD